MKTLSSNVFDDYVQAAKLKNASLRYCFARDVFDQVGGLTEKFDAEIHAIIRSLTDSKDKNLDVAQAADLGEELVIATEGEKNDDNAHQHDPADFEASNESEEEARLRKLFKQIAVKCHPDKLMHKDISSREFHFLLSSYETARQALDDDDEPSMVCTGIDLQIVGELGAEGSFTLLSNTASQLEKKSDELRQSALWVWGSINDDFDAKARILCSILKQFYGKNIPENRVKEAVCRYFNNEKIEMKNSPTKKRRPGEHPGKHLRQRRNHDG